MWTPETYAALGAVLLGGALSGYALARQHRRRRTRQRAQAAVAQEAAAAAKLRSAGYRIEAQQARAQGLMRVDAQAQSFGLRADFLVRRGGRRFVAEVKSGELAPSLNHGPTRRQLLEYALYFEVDGVLLVSMPAGTIQELTFPALSRRYKPGQHAWPYLLGGTAVGAVATWLLRS